MSGGVSDQRGPDLPKYRPDAVETAEFIKKSFSSSQLELLSSVSDPSSIKISPTLSSRDSTKLQ